MLKFQGKIALITGCGTGIGKAIAKKFVENGAGVIILGRRKEPLVETSEMLEEANPIAALRHIFSVCVDSIFLGNLSFK